MRRVVAGARIAAGILVALAGLVVCGVGSAMHVGNLS
jgi:hypothetical protein